MRSFLILALMFFALVAVPSASLANSTESPVVLTVVVRGSGAETQFNRDDLDKLPQITYRTSTIWTNGVLEFQGVPLRAVLKAAGVTNGLLLLGASNDYAAEIPIATVTDDVPMIAISIDGKPMSLREKGPLWLVYPYDTSTEYQSEVIYTRSVWQLERIEVVP